MHPVSHRPSVQGVFHRCLLGGVPTEGLPLVGQGCACRSLWKLPGAMWQYTLLWQREPEWEDGEAPLGQVKLVCGDSGLPHQLSDGVKQRLLEVSHISCVCATGCALSRWTTRGACSPAVSPCNFSGRTAILFKSLTTAAVTSWR